ncbi:MAG: carboxypeptidase regulatory-like domain-containing protein [Rikenellaceae bacterium]|nr:carboxypeptidase regulatory-like domain-containing protein [Rikenellaceae bacterium]
MKIKSLLTLLLALVTLTASAQIGGVKGRVVSRANRMPVSGVTITLAPTGEAVTTDSEGNFSFDMVEKGSYNLTFEADEFESLTLQVRVDQMVRDLRTVVLVPAMPQEVLDDSIFMEFDTETADDSNALPTSLSASRDLFNNIASFNFSEMRFNVRGYDSQYQDVYMNGVKLNDALTGYSPWSLWTGLNDATRNQEVTSGLTGSDVGLGGIGGTTNINTLPSQMRKGLRASLVSANQSYRFRAMATYASGLQDNGWAYAFSLSTRQGGNDYVKGVYYNTFGYFAAVEKQFDGGRHRLALTLLGSPTERGAQQAAVQEVYDLVGNNYYNPNWGYQDGKERNARVRENHEPLTMLNYQFNISERSRLTAAASFRFGRNGYSALTWQDGADPRPDYYRYLPSYFVRDNNLEQAAWQYERWRANYNNIRHLQWDSFYQTNYTRENAIDKEIYGEGARANYMVEERHTDQRDWNFYVNFQHIFKNNSKLNAGVNLRRNRTEYYSQVKDLLGADYWVDEDKFAERDFADVLAKQNNLDYYNTHGHAHAAKVGDKYNYDYYAHVLKANAWASYAMQVGGLAMTFGGEVGTTKLWREGLWQKGLFPNNSKGDSEKLDFLNFKGKANFEYRFSANHALEANVVYMQQAPEFRSAFVSPRTRNTVTPNLEEEKVLGVDASYDLRYGDLKLRLTGYFTRIEDQTDLMSYYDDVNSSFTNFAMSGVDKLHFGLEAAFQLPLYRGLSLRGALSWGQYTYDSNPYYVQTRDNSAEVISEGRVYWEDFRVESTPQLAANLGLNFRSNNNWFLSFDCNYYDNMYLSMSPVYRTDEVLSSSMTDADIAYMRKQEKFDDAFVLGASIGKNWSIKYKYTLGFSLSVDNLLNNQDIKTGGYEQTRLVKNTETTVDSYQPFESKYFYMFGTTYYLNLYFRF